MTHTTQIKDFLKLKLRQLRKQNKNSHYEVDTQKLSKLSGTGRRKNIWPKKLHFFELCTKL